MRVLYDPATIFFTVATVASTAINVASARQQGNAAAEQAQAEAAAAATQAEREAAFVGEQQQTEEIASQREQRDVAKERARRISATRAALAASGADLSSGSALAILKDQGAEFATRAERLGQDTRLTQDSLKRRQRGELERAEGERRRGAAEARSARRAGRLNAAGEVVKGATLLGDRLIPQFNKAPPSTGG